MTTFYAFKQCFKKFVHYAQIMLFMLNKSIDLINVTESWKTVPNHTSLFHYIYYCNMNDITFSTVYIISYHHMEFNAQIIKIVQ